MAQQDDLQTLLIEGWRFGQYGPGLDPAVFATFGGGSAWSEPSLPPGWSEAEILAGLQNTTPLEEVTVTAAPTKAFVPPPVPPSLIAPVVETIAAGASAVGAAIVAGAGGLLGLLLPSPLAPRELDEAPMPQVDVTGNVKKPPPLAPLFSDVPLPPNWNDLSRPPNDMHDSPFFITTFPIPIGDPDARRDRERRNKPAPRSPGVDPAGGELDEVTVTGRRAPRPAPDDVTFDFLVPAFEVPFGFSVPIGDPDLEPLAQPLPSRRPTPRPDLIDAPNLFANPALDPLPFAPVWPEPYAPPSVAPEPKVDVPVDIEVPLPTDVFPRSPAPPFGFLDPIAPDFALDPQPSDLIPEKPTGADTCACAKPKKKKKQRKPRTICRKGTYVESALGLRKSPNSLVNCETGEEFGSDRM